MIDIAANFISFGNGKRHSFLNTIAEYLVFEDAVVIRLSEDPMHRTNENIYSFDHSGRLLWQIPIRSHLVSISPYVSIMTHGVNIEALNMDGYALTLRPKSGVVVTEGYYPVCSHRVIRQASKRRWI